MDLQEKIDQDFDLEMLIHSFVSREELERFKNEIIQIVLLD